MIHSVEGAEHRTDGEAETMRVEAGGIHCWILREEFLNRHETEGITKKGERK